MTQSTDLEFYDIVKPLKWKRIRISKIRATTKCTNLQ